MIEPFAAVEIIAAKRDRNELTDPQIDLSLIHI
jgi:thymidine phosphorylase